LECNYAEDRDRPYWPNPLGALKHGEKEYHDKFEELLN
jgi:hypothetical protein